MEVFDRCQKFLRVSEVCASIWKVSKVLKVPRNVEGFHKFPQVFGRFRRYQWDANSLLGISLELLKPRYPYIIDHVIFTALTAYCCVLLLKTY